MTRLKAALLAAAVTAGLPAMAMAQERPDREDRQRSEGPREQRKGQGARPDRGPPPQQQAPQPQPAPQPPRQPQPDQGQIRAQQVEQQRNQQTQARNQQRTMEQRRGQDRGNFNGDPRNERAQNYSGNNLDTGSRGFDGRSNYGRGYDGRPNDNRANDNWGGGIRTERYRGNDRFGGAVRGNDWRQDRRYDWRGYRDQHRDLFRAPRYVAPRNWSYGYRRFEIGFRLPSFFFGEQYWIADPYAYRLPPAYGPYRWVRYYDDVLLIDLRTGEVVDAIPGFFY